jgi:hypothetical protein
LEHLGRAAEIEKRALVIRGNCKISSARLRISSQQKLAAVSAGFVAAEQAFADALSQRAKYRLARFSKINLHVTSPCA